MSYSPETQQHLASAEVALAAGDTETAGGHFVQVVRDAPTGDVKRLVEEVTTTARAVASQQ